MNWTTRTTTFNFNDCDCCEHVEKDHKLAHVQVMENDSFGPVCGFILCKECDALPSGELVDCHDCGKEVDIDKTKEWKDFDDCGSDAEVIHVCLECAEKAPHKARIQSNINAFEEYEKEFGTCDQW